MKRVLLCREWRWGAPRQEEQYPKSQRQERVQNREEARGLLWVLRVLAALSFPKYTSRFCPGLAKSSHSAAIQRKGIVLLFLERSFFCG